MNASLDQVELKPIKGYEWRKLNVPSVLVTRDPGFHTHYTFYHSEHLNGVKSVTEREYQN